MDFPAPVANQIQVPQAPNGLGMLSSILGIKQQQQQLRSATAEASQAEQQNSELQALAKFTHSAASDPSYLNSDGTPNVEKYQRDAMTVAPVYGQSYIGQMTGNFNSGVENRKALLSLSADQQQKAAGFFASVAANPNATNDDFLNAAEQARGLSSDRTYQRTIDRMLMHAPQTAMLPSDKASQAIRQYGRMVAIQANAPQAAESAPQVSTMQAPGGLQAVNTNPQNPQGVGPVGAPMSQGLAPTEKLPYVRARGAAGTEGAQGAANDEALYNDIVQKGTKAVQLKALTQDIRNLSAEVQTGQYSKATADKWSALKQTFGFKPDDDSFETKRQILSKMAAQLRAQSESGASTDAERAGIEAALPDPEHMGPAAVAQAARYVGALADTQAARARLANQHRQVNGGKSTGIREADSAFMQNADPRVFEYQSIPPGQERQNYLRQHFKSKEEVKAFLDKQQVLRAYGALQ